MKLKGKRKKWILKCKTFKLSPRGNAVPPLPRSTSRFLFPRNSSRRTDRSTRHATYLILFRWIRDRHFYIRWNFGYVRRSLKTERILPGTAIVTLTYILIFAPTFDTQIRVYVSSKYKNGIVETSPWLLRDARHPFVARFLPDNDGKSLPRHPRDTFLALKYPFFFLSERRFDDAEASRYLLRREKGEERWIAR